MKNNSTKVAKLWILLIFAICFVALSIMGANEASAQTVSKPNCKFENGKFIATTSSTKWTDTVCGKVYTSADKKDYPVFISKNGNYYIWRVSKKTGKQYKYYLKTD